MSSSQQARQADRWCVEVPRVRLSYYRSSTEPFKESPIHAELSKLPETTSAEVTSAMNMISDFTEFPSPRSYPSRGRVRCVGVWREDYTVYVFYARIDHQRKIVVLHVTDCLVAGPPDEGYGLARSRLEDMPV